MKQDKNGQIESFPNNNNNDDKEKDLENGLFLLGV